MQYAENHLIDSSRHDWDILTNAHSQSAPEALGAGEFFLRREEYNFQWWGGGHKSDRILAAMRRFF